MKGRTIVLLILAALIWILPTIAQADKVNDLETEAESARINAAEGKAKREQLEDLVSQLGEDVTTLRDQAEGSGLTPVVPPVEETLEDFGEGSIPPRDNSPTRIVAGPTPESLQAAVAACLASGACVIPPGPQGPEGAMGQMGLPGLNGLNGADANPVTNEQLLEVVETCFAEGFCVAPQGPIGETGATGAEGPMGPPIASFTIEGVVGTQTCTRDEGSPDAAPTYTCKHDGPPDPPPNQ